MSSYRPKVCCCWSCERSLGFHDTIPENTKLLLPASVDKRRSGWVRRKCVGLARDMSTTQASFCKRRLRSGENQQEYTVDLLFVKAVMSVGRQKNHGLFFQKVGKQHLPLCAWAQRCEGKTWSETTGGFLPLCLFLCFRSTAVGTGDPTQGCQNVCFLSWSSPFPPNTTSRARAPTLANFTLGFTLSREPATANRSGNASVNDRKTSTLLLPLFLPQTSDADDPRSHTHNRRVCSSDFIFVEEKLYARTLLSALHRSRRKVLFTTSAGKYWSCIDSSVSCCAPLRLPEAPTLHRQQRTSRAVRATSLPRASCHSSGYNERVRTYPRGTVQARIARKMKFTTQQSAQHLPSTRMYVRVGVCIWVRSCVCMPLLAQICIVETRCQSATSPHLSRGHSLLSGLLRYSNVGWQPRLVGCVSPCEHDKGGSFPPCLILRFVRCKAQTLIQTGQTVLCTFSATSPLL